MARKKTIADARCEPYGGETELKHIRKARQCLLRYMSTKMVITGSTPDEAVIEKFAQDRNYLIPEAQDRKEWLMQLYHNDQDEIIQKEDYAFYASKE